MRKIIQIGLSLALLAPLSASMLKAKQSLSDDQTYRIVDVKKDGSLEIIQEYQNDKDAYKNYNQLLDQYDNLSLAYGTTYLEAETALVAFKKSNTCDVNVEYRDAKTGADGYTNGCYGGDGAYLASDEESVTFKLSGIVAKASIDDVTIVPFAQGRVSYYTVKNKRLYHYIKTNVEASGYSNILSLGIAPAALHEDVVYYSYDGHYFYQDYAMMINDYRSQSYEHAINAKEPYYNYYQYISHRSTSNYTHEDLSRAWQSAFGMNKTISAFVHDGSYTHLNLNESLLLQGSEAFFQYQNQYGVNAMMMLSLAMNESSYGRSSLAYSRNNLFGHAAYDEDVDSNATGYRKVADSIYFHANHYISHSYLNPDNFTYHGAQFGNKTGGLNVSYASDPYWGEKAAQFYLNIDEALGSKDYEAYRIGVSYQKDVAIKKAASEGSSTIYQVPQHQETSFIILKEVESNQGLWYQVALDLPVLENNVNRIYDFNKAVGYVKASDLDYASKTKPTPKEYINIHFDAGKGSYYPNQQVVTLSVEKNHIPAMTAPEYSQHHFIGYQKEIAPATEETTYQAQYLKIDNVEVVGSPQTEYYVGEYLNLSNLILKVTCQDQVFEFPLTSDHTSGFTSRTIGKRQYVVTYNGYQIPISYEVKEFSDTLKGSMVSQAASIIAACEANNSQLSAENHEKLQALFTQIQETKQNPLDIATLRYLDRVNEPYNQPRISVVFNDNPYDLQVSGLSFQDIPTSFLTSYVPVTIQVNLNATNKYKELIERATATNYYHLEDLFEIDLKADFSHLELQHEMVYSLQKPTDHENKLYRILEVNKDGEVKQVASEQSKERITFKAKQGTFALVSISQAGLEDTFDFTEVYHQGRSMKNYISLIQTIAIAAGTVSIIVVGGIIFFILKRKKKQK